MTHAAAIPAIHSSDGPRLGEVKAPTPSVPERTGKTLLGWIQEPDVRPLFIASSVTSPPSVEDFIGACRVARAARPQPTGTLPPPPAIEPLPAALESRASVLRASEQFRTAYEPFGAQFVRVPLAELVTPQWWVDTEYVEALAQAAPAEDDLDGMFSFSFATGSLAMPMHLGTNGAAFASAKNDIGPPSPLRFARYSPEKVTFEFDVTPRPNWVWLAACQDMNRLLILNGVHHLLALLKAGRQHALCLLRHSQSVAADPSLGLPPQEPAIFKPGELTSARPPLLRDYLDEQLAADVGIHLRQSFLRLVLQAELGVIPRVE
jgi:hypothetical protein